MMEQAIFVSAAIFDEVHEPYSRLYFGNEFCQRLLPQPGELDAALAWAQARRMAFTLVTPYVSGEALSALDVLFQRLARCAEASFEVVVNDWGVLHLLTEGRWKGAFIPVLGRLLTKQRRDPRIPILRSLPEAARQHLKSANIDAPPLSDFLRSRGIERVELDNPPQGLVRGGTMSASIYVPFGYISTTRLCYMAGADAGSRGLRRIAPCARQCRAYTATLTAKGLPGKILLKGNTQFFVNESLPGDLERLHVDRLVRQPVIPM